MESCGTSPSESEDRSSSSQESATGSLTFDLLVLAVDLSSESCDIDVDTSFCLVSGMAEYVSLEVLDAGVMNTGDITDNGDLDGYEREGDISADSNPGVRLIYRRSVVDRGDAERRKREGKALYWRKRRSCRPEMSDTVRGSTMLGRHESEGEQVVRSPTSLHVKVSFIFAHVKWGWHEPHSRLEFPASRRG